MKTPAARRNGGAKRTRAARSRAAPSRELAAEYVSRLKRAYPHARCTLDHHNAFQLLVATILSAQCTDARVNMVTPTLFARLPDPEAMADADPELIEELIKSTGFFRSKTKSLRGMARALVERHGAQVPSTMEELTKLPGVGRKTANVILGNAFGKNEGIVVDTHVARLGQRLGLARDADPVRIEQELMLLVERDDWTLFSHLLIDHGRAVCHARAPKCSACMLSDFCPSAFRVEGSV